MTRILPSRLFLWAFLILGLLTMDTWLYRDPCVDLGMGYQVSRDSPGSESCLSYHRERDPRSYSVWTGGVISTRLPNTNADSIGYYLRNAETGEFLSFKAKDAWLKAMVDHNASRVSDTLAEGLDELTKEASIVYGRGSAGFFVLDIAGNDLYVTPSHDDWVSKVRDKIGKTPRFDLRPISRWQTRRDPAYVALLGVVLMTAAALQVWELARALKKVSGVRAP